MPYTTLKDYNMICSYSNLNIFVKSTYLEDELYFEYNVRKWENILIKKI